MSKYVCKAILVWVALLISSSTLPAQQLEWTDRSRLNMVATVHPQATQAGIEAFEKGGNAIDAVVAAALTLGVVDGYNSGIGGGCFILIRRADGEVFAIDGREMAPLAATRDMYLRDGKPVSSLSKVGPLASGIPGALAAFERAVDQHGKLSLRELIEPAAEIAEQGFKVRPVYEEALNSTATELRKFSGSKSVLLKPDGSVYQAGELLIQTDLAKTYREIAEQGTGWFYGGSFAEKTAAWMKENGGILTVEDFAGYKTVDRKPIRTQYRGYELIGFPPPSSGGVHVAQILNILENFDLAEMHRKNPQQMKHVVAEAMKLAFADRAFWLGDPDYAKVPRGLIDKTYAQSLASKIDIDQVIAVDSHGTPPRSTEDFFSKHTTHLCAADKEGNWVALTSTVNTPFGAKVIVPGLGVVMNNQMDDFSIAPGAPNTYGLIGAESNSIAPSKRPLSSMSPTIVLKEGQPVMTVGAAGGPKIITQTVWAIINHLDLKMPIGEAIATKRIHHQWSPDRLLVESSLPKRDIEFFRSVGHQIETRAAIGISQAISFDPETGLFEGAHDPRVPGKAAGQR